MDYTLLQVSMLILLLVIALGIYNLKRNEGKNIKAYRAVNAMVGLLIASGVSLLIMAVLPYGNFYGCVMNTLPMSGEKIVALTYDDGPYHPYTQELLEVLRQENVKATFFMVGKNAQRYPELVKAVQRDGHTIGVHTFSHADLLRLDWQGKNYQIQAGAESIQKITGIKPKLFRPPHGFRDWQVMSAVEAAELKFVNWSVLSKDWLNPSPEEIARRTLADIKSGDIILLHDGDSPYGKSSRANTVAATRLIIKNLKAQGYRFVTVPE